MDKLFGWYAVPCVQSIQTQFPACHMSHASPLFYLAMPRSPRTNSYTEGKGVLFFHIKYAIQNVQDLDTPCRLAIKERRRDGKRESLYSNRDTTGKKCAMGGNGWSERE